MGLRQGRPLPRYVLDLPGGFGKVPVEAPHVIQTEDGSWRARDRFGVEHRYKMGTRCVCKREKFYKLNLATAFDS